MEKCSLQMKDIIKSYNGVTALKVSVSMCGRAKSTHC